jgi:hypothetical protein
MPNFLEYLRQQNIFGSPPINGGSLPQPINAQGMNPFLPQDIAAPSGGVALNDTEAPQNPYAVNFGSGPLNINQNDIQQARQTGQELPYDVASRMKELYQPTNDASQRLDQFINQYPGREKPGLLRKVGAMLVDYTKGHQAGEEFYDRPFKEKQEDWKNKVGPIENAANLERYQNTNNRTLAYQTVSEELRNKTQESREKNDTRNAEIRQQRADIYAFKAQNPDLKIIITKDGNVMAMNPRTGQTKDTGIPTGSLTELDKMNLGQEQKLEQINASGTQQRETEGVKQGGREAIAETRGWKVYNIPDKANPGQIKAVKINEITGEVRDIKSDEVNVPGVTKPTSSGTGTKGEPATQKRVREFSAAQKIRNTRPDLAQFIKLGTPGANDFEVSKPGKGYFGNSTGPSQDQYDEISKIIYGNTTGPVNTSGTIRVRKGNQTGTFKGTAAEATAAGYEVIRQ